MKLINIEKQEVEMKIKMIGFIFFSLSAVSNALVSDPLISYQWAVYNHGVPQAIDLDPVKNYRIPARFREDMHIYELDSHPALTPVIVAVLDTGVQKDHPDLKNRLFRKESECKALAKFEDCIKNSDRKSCEKTWMDISNPEVDQDKNGYPLDCEGWSLLGGVNAANIMGRPDFGDDQGHGTHVAGIIGAEANNGIGIRGGSQNIRILPVQVLGRQPSEPVKPLSIYDEATEAGKESITKSLGDLVARGVIYANRSGAKVINFSMGWPQSRDSEYMRKVIAAAQADGITIVAAAGNDSTGALLRPCAYPGVICVGAHGPDGALAHFSNFGNGVDIAAPGVNILSTYPEAKRPVRYRSSLGYEYLSGTSQAAPYVAAAVGEMLVRGVPQHEILPRLIIGARQVQKGMGLLEGTTSTGLKDLGVLADVRPHFILSGNLDVQGALIAIPEPVILPKSKEKIEINWDRQSRKLFWKFALVNHWVSGFDIQVDAKINSPSVRVKQISEEVPYIREWSSGEERTYIAELEIFDGVKPEQSRLASELSLDVKVVSGSRELHHRIEADVLVDLTENTTGDDIENLPIQGLPLGRISFLPIDENLDKNVTQRDYLARSENGNQWELTLLKQKSQGFVAQGTGKIRIETSGQDLENIREQYLLRMDWDLNGESDYVVGLIEDLSGDEKAEFSPVTFFVFNEKMKKLGSFKYEARLAEMPFDIVWHNAGTKLMPAWVGPGRSTDKKRGLRDLWENPEDLEKKEIRFYFLDDEGKLKSVQKINDYKIVDLLEGSSEEKAQGRAKVLLAKNLGTIAKPSYLYDFATAEVYKGKIQGFMPLGKMGDENLYRNILDTRVDKLLSLNIDNRAAAGNFWFSEGYEREQRLSLFDGASGDWQDADLKALRYQFDSALWVRAAFIGRKRSGAFVLTNSEIQYHDLNSGNVVSHSMDRYTFYPDMLMTNLYFPLVIGDSQDASSRIPALFTTESSKLSRGVKVLAAIFAVDGSVVELVSPARLRFVSKSGCRPMDTPVFTGGVNGSAFDYFCGSKILRVHLKL